MLEHIKIKEWEEKFDIEKKAQEQEEIRKEQRLVRKEFDKITKFEDLKKQPSELDLKLENLDIDKSTKN